MGNKGWVNFFQLGHERPCELSKQASVQIRKRENLGVGNNFFTAEAIHRWDDLTGYMDQTMFKNKIRRAIKREIIEASSFL